METNTTCPNCHKPIEADATFCGKCGYKLSPKTSPAKPKPLVAAEVSKPSMSPGVMVVDGVPSYAKDKSESPDEKKSILALIIGVIGIPAALLPILGLVLGLTGLILGIRARVRYKHTLNLLAIIFSAIAVIMAIGLFVSNVNSQKNYTQKGPFTTISTPCYSVQVDKGLSRNVHRGCSFYTAGKGEEFEVVAINNAKIIPTNLEAEGSLYLHNVAVKAGGKISNGHIGTFAGSMAYLADYTSSSKGNSGAFAFVLHKTTAKKDNIFVVGRAVNGSGLNNLGTLQSTWKWQ
jgi:hypothetical protein